MAFIFYIITGDTFSLFNWNPGGNIWLPVTMITCKTYINTPKMKAANKALLLTSPTFSHIWLYLGLKWSTERLGWMAGSWEKFWYIYSLSRFLPNGGNIMTKVYICILFILTKTLISDISLSLDGLTPRMFNKCTLNSSQNWGVR